MTNEAKFVTSYEDIVVQTVVKLREANKLNQKEISEAIGVSTATWSRIESGQSGLSLDQLKLVADTLKISAHNILKIADAIIEETANLEVKNKKELVSAFSIGTGLLASAGIFGLLPISGSILGGFLGTNIATHVNNLIKENNKKKK